ncbi:MAG: circadian clock KaiB family protein [Myxococcota bacterium]
MTRGPYQLTLFVAGQHANSILAQRNLEHMCAEYLREGACTITVVDVVQDFQAAIDADVVVTPTLIVEGPRGRSVILGNLSDVDRIVLTLGLNR